MKSIIEKLQFWQQPEYHNYHVGAVVATLKEAESYIRELEETLEPFVPDTDIDAEEYTSVWNNHLIQARKVLGECGE